MRSVNKTTMDALVRIVRKYWAMGDVDIFDLKHNKGNELSEQAYGSDSKWLPLLDIVESVINLNQNTSNDTIYKIFGLLGIEVEAGADAD